MRRGVTDAVEEHLPLLVQIVAHLLDHWVTGRRRRGAAEDAVAQTALAVEHDDDADDADDADDGGGGNEVCAALGAVPHAFAAGRRALAAMENFLDPSGRVWNAPEPRASRPPADL